MGQENTSFLRCTGSAARPASLGASPASMRKSLKVCLLLLPQSTMVHANLGALSEVLASRKHSTKPNSVKRVSKAYAHLSQRKTSSKKLDGDGTGLRGFFYNCRCRSWSGPVRSGPSPAMPYLTPAASVFFFLPLMLSWLFLCQPYAITATANVPATATSLPRQDT